MSAARLREAARLMRARAEAATPGPWCVMSEDEKMFVTTGPTGRDVAEVYEWSTGLGNPEHIAAMRPAVALAVADWLDRAADEEWCCDECKFAPENTQNLAHDALAVANAYLGANDE